MVRHDPAYRGPRAWSAVALVGICLIAGWLIAWPLHERQSGMASFWVPLGFTVALASLPVVVSGLIRAAGGKARSDIFSPSRIFPFFFVLVYCAGFSEVLLSWYGVPVREYLCCMLGLASFYAGILIASRSNAWIQYDAPFMKTDRWIERWDYRRRARYCVILLYVIGFGAMLRYIQLAGVTALARDVLHGRVFAFERTGLYLSFLATTLNIAVIVTLIMVLRKKATLAQKSVFLLLACTVFLLLLGTANRALAIFPLAPMAIIYHYTRKKLRVAHLLLACLILVAFVASAQLVRDLRSSEWSGRLMVWSSDDIAPLEKALRLARGPFVNAFRNYALVMRMFPAQIPFLGGRGLGMTVATILPGRQIPLTIYLQEQSGQEFVGFGTTPTILGGFYLDFGVAGIVVGMFAVGLLLQLLYRRMCARPCESRILTYAVVLACAVASINGGLLVNSLRPLWYVFLVLAAGWMCRRRPATPALAGNRALPIVPEEPAVGGSYSA